MNNKVQMYVNFFYPLLTEKKQNKPFSKRTYVMICESLLFEFQKNEKKLKFHFLPD